jgi:poly(A) polymerase
LGSILPEVSALVDFGDGEWRHKDVWKHTKQVVLQAEPKVDLRWAAMLHDIGKVRTRSISPDGEVHFFGHAEVGARMFDKIERRVGLFRNEESLRVTVRFLILHHLRANQYERSWTDSAVRRFAKDLGSELQNLLCLARADITTKRPEKKRRGLQQIDELAKRIAELAEQDAIVPPLPSGIGNLIMETFRIPPSKLIGNVKVALEQAVDSGDLPSHQPSEFYVEYLKENAERFGLPKIA